MLGRKAIFFFGRLDRHDMQRFENVDVAALVHHGDIRLADGDKLRMRHLKLTPIRRTDDKRPETATDLLAYSLDLHTVSLPLIKVCINPPTLRWAAHRHRRGI